MFGRRVLLLLFLSITWLGARADIFVVTSNADSGPGTLRDALTLAAANGSTVKDFINFNLPDVSEAGRTITLTSQLPDVSSNLVIDGSTQPGAVFGVSTTRVALLYKVPDSQKLSGLRAIEQQDIVIYGLYIKTYATVTEPATTMIGYWTAIELNNDKNVQIGAAGKGNVCFGFSYSISINPNNSGQYFDNLSIKANFFGIDADGETTSARTGTAGLYFLTGQVTIGGTEAEGNLFAQGLMVYQQNNVDYVEPGSYYFNAEAIFLVKNNKIGVDYAVQRALANCAGLFLGTGTPNGKNTINIEDNIITSDIRDAIYIINNGRKATLLRNYIGTDKLRQKSFPVAGNGIFIYWDTEQVAVGSNNPADANYITNCYNAVWVWPFTYATVNKNSFYCIRSHDPMHLDDYGAFPYPFVKMHSITSGGVTGTATPNAAIELFYSDQCNTCSPQTYFGSATADNNGNWAYTGPIKGSVIASATFGKSTSNFTTTTISTENLKVINACGGKGSIVGATVSNAANIKWLDELGNTAGTQPDLKDVKPGKYKMVAANGDCSASTEYFEIVEGFELTTAAPVIKKSSCGQNDGSIKGIGITNNDGTPVSLSWKDQNGKEWGTQPDIEGIPQGRYILTATATTSGCTETYGPVVIADETAPTIDQSNALLTDATCDNYDGSIKGLKVSPGSFTYFWTNENSKVFPANGPDLENIPPGTYTLNVKYGECAPVQSTPITISSKNGVSIDFITQSGRSATCNESNGEITGLRAPGATSYAWRSKSGSAVLSDKLDLKGVPAGIYTLTIINATCSKDIDFEIPGFPPTVFTGITYTNTKTCQAFNTGSITVNTDNANEQPLKYRWVNTTGENVGFDKTVQFLPVGTYKLYLTDKNYCENPYPEIYTIGAYPEFKVVTFGTVTNTQCGVGTGGVTATTVTGGTGNYVYQWLDAGNNTIGSQASMDNLAPGAYKLRITDGGCSLAEIPYNITDEAATPPAPFADNVRVYNPGKVTIKVNDPFPTAIYRLYESATSQPPLQDAIGGAFNIDVTESRSYYVSLTYGYCESNRTEVQVFVSALKGGIANTFTPNGDGVNDYWVVEGLSTYPDAVVSVFNRYGQAVFQSIGYAKPFDGNHNGKPLPAGVYYYLIDLKNNNRLSGNVTILR